MSKLDSKRLLTLSPVPCYTNLTLGTFKPVPCLLSPVPYINAVAALWHHILYANTALKVQYANCRRSVGDSTLSHG